MRIPDRRFKIPGLPLKDPVLPNQLHGRVGQAFFGVVARSWHGPRWPLFTNRSTIFRGNFRPAIAARRLPSRERSTGHGWCRSPRFSGHHLRLVGGQDRLPSLGQPMNLDYPCPYGCRHYGQRRRLGRLRAAVLSGRRSSRRWLKICKIFLQGGFVPEGQIPPRET
jgi:hypothetical protein